MPSYVVNLDATANLIRLTVSGTYSSSSTVVSISPGMVSLLPAPPFNLVWWNGTTYSSPVLDPDAEIVRCTIVNSGANTITVTRAQEGTAATAKNTAGATYYMILAITEKMINDIQTGLRLPYQYQPLIGAIDGINTVYTFTPVPNDLNSCNVSLAQQPQIIGTNITISISGSNGVVTYISGAPDPSLNGKPHVIQYL